VVINVKNILLAGSGSANPKQEDLLLTSKYKWHKLLELYKLFQGDMNFDLFANDYLKISQHGIHSCESQTIASPVQPRNGYFVPSTTVICILTIFTSPNYQSIYRQFSSSFQFLSLSIYTYPHGTTYHIHLKCNPGTAH